MCSSFCAGSHVTETRFLEGLGGVIFLGAVDDLEACKTASDTFSRQNMGLKCLKAENFAPKIVKTFPKEGLAHAVLSWLQVRPCDWTFPLAPPPQPLSTPLPLSLPPHFRAFPASSSSFCDPFFVEAYWSKGRVLLRTLV